MSSPVTLSSCYNNCMWAYSAVIRRQLFLVRTLGGYCCSFHAPKMQGIDSAKVSVSEVVAENIIERITPKLDPIRYKGQAGKIAVVGGCREYTGAPYFAAISAIKIGADLSHVFCTKDAATVIKSYSPELIVHPVLEESYSARDDVKDSVRSKVLAEVGKWIQQFDCIVVGPGLGRDPFLLDCSSGIIRHARQESIPIVIDGDGLFLVTNDLNLVSGNPFAVLTPNVNEYKRLIEKAMGCEVDDEDPATQLLSLSRRIGGVTILRKGKVDFISDGETVSTVSIFGSPRRCGGQGDILSGSVALFSAWARHHLSSTATEATGTSSSNPMVLGCIAGSTLLRRSAALAFEKNKRATLTTDIIEYLGKSLEEICPAE